MGLGTSAPISTSSAPILTPTPTPMSASPDIENDIETMKTAEFLNSLPTVVLEKEFIQKLADLKEDRERCLAEVRDIYDHDDRDKTLYAEMHSLLCGDDPKKEMALTHSVREDYKINEKFDKERGVLLRGLLKALSDMYR